MIFHCPFSPTYWHTLGMVWDATGDRLQILEGGKRIWTKPSIMELFMLSSWNIWKERNQLLF
jgi:hypothetical protein